jgi:DNA-directed RNA polymerase II subunit RPB1
MIINNIVMQRQNGSFNSNVAVIKSVQFGVLSPEEITSQSVAKIYQHAMATNKGNYGVGTLDDPHLSATTMFLNASSDLNYKNDPGNFGHCELVKPVYNPFFHSTVMDIMKVICPACGELRVAKKDYSIRSLQEEIRNVTPSARLKALLERFKTKTNCDFCDSYLPEIVNTSAEEVLGIGFAYNLAKAKNKGITLIQDKDDEVKGKRLIKKVINDQIYQSLRRISDVTAEIMGFDVKVTKPSSLMITILPICPPTVRPSVVADGKTADDDLSQSLYNILKHNNMLRLDSTDVEGERGDKRISQERDLQLRVAALIDNTRKPGRSGYPPVCNRTNRPLVTIKSRISGKEGRFRGNLQGKRTDYNTRSVITADPNISIGDTGVPIEVCKILTFPEIVNHFNRRHLETLVVAGPLDHPGANEVLYPGQSYPINLSCRTKEEREAMLPLKIGTIVYRHLMLGDPVLFNRQPSLHRMNAMCHRTFPLLGRTLRANPDITEPYGADFDGDEMNLHVPQSVRTQQELDCLARPSTQMISPQASKPIIGCVQDTRLAGYLLSSPTTRGFGKGQNDWINYRDFLSLTSWLSQGKSILPDPQVHGWTTNDLLGMMLPNVTISANAGAVRIINGVLQLPKDGTHPHPMDKDSGLLGTSANSLFHRIWNDLGHEAASDLMDDLSRMSSQWLITQNFTVSLRDMKLPDKYMQEIEVIKADYINKVEQLIAGLHNNQYTDEFRNSLGLKHRGLTTNNGDQFEEDINFLLNSCKDRCQEIAAKNIREYEVGQKFDNHFMAMVDSGSKGKKTNVVQIVSILGGQDMLGGRATNAYPRRPLPFIPKDEWGDVERGMVYDNYMTGLDFLGTWYHNIAGRNGVISTSIKTAETGYMQRRLMKLMEDLTVVYDGTVQGNGGIVVDYLYGGDGFEATRLEKQTIEHMCLSREGIEHNYNFKENDWNTLRNDMCHNNVVYDQDVEQASLNDEINALQADWDYLRGRYVYNIPAYVNSVINFDQIIDNVLYMMGISGTAPYLDTNDMLKPSYIKAGINELQKTLRQPSSQSVGDHSLRQFFSLLRSKLTSRALIMRKQLNRHAFDTILQQIRDRFYQGLVPAGTAVGAIAAQSIGERGTQMTLDSFHSTGSKAEVSSGLPRLQEILSVTKMKTPSMTLYINQKKIPIPDVIMSIIRSSDKWLNAEATVDTVDNYLQSLPTEEAQARLTEFLEMYAAKVVKPLRNSLEYTTFRDVIKTSYITYSSSGKNDTDTFDSDNTVEEPTWFIDYYLDDQSNLDEKDIQRFIARELTQQVEFITSIGNRSSYVRQRFTSKEIEQGLETDEETKDIMTYIDNIREKFLKHLIKGTQGITATTMERVEQDIHLPNGAIIPCHHKSYKEIAKTFFSAHAFVIKTAGSNLIGTLGMDEVDPMRSYSNDIVEMKEIFGIEAARKAIMREIRVVLEASQADVDERHLRLLAASMTSRGFLQKIDRYGAKKGEAGPLALASFEETASVLTKAAMFGQRDTLKGVSSRIMFAQFIRAGTGAFSLEMDEDVLKKYAVNLEEKEEQDIKIRQRDMQCLNLDNFQFQL